MLDTSTRRRIDDARDILVGKIPDPKSQVEQITIALIYKFMDDMDTESEELGGKAKFFVGDYKKYSWRKVYNKTRGGQEILLDYREALQKMSENPSLPSIFHTIFRQAYLPYNDPETLKEFLKIINQFDYDHSEKLGDAFEYLLSVLGSQGDAGQFRTPRHIIDFIVAIVEPKKNETILDPACGTAGFLISSYKYILKSNSSKGKNNGDLLTPDERKRLSENISGYDISPDMVRLSLVNMYLHQITEPKIVEYDTLTSDTKWNEYFDVMLANPPFMSPKGGIKPHSRFSVQSKRSEALFVDYIAEHLTITGRGAVIVPEGVIFKSDTAFTKLRKMLVEDNYLYGVISLPSGVFNPYSGVKTSILLFDKVISKLTDKILFTKVENDGFSLGAQRRPIDGCQLGPIASMIRAFRISLHRGEAFESDLCTLVDKSKIAESRDYNLSGERYVTIQITLNKYPMTKLGDIVEVLDYKRRPISKADRISGEYPYYGATGIVDYINDYIFDEELVLVGEDGAKWNSTDKSAFIAKGKYWVNNHAHVIKPSIDELHPVYLVEQLNYMDLMPYISGVTVPKLNQEKLKSIEIPLPSLDEQRAIVAEIEGYQRIIDAARTIVDNYHPQITIDPNWQMVELESIAELINGRAYKQKELLNEGKYKVLRVGNFFSNKDYYYSDLELDTDKYCHKGDLLFAWSASFGPKIWNEDNTIFHYHIWKVKTKDNINKQFLYYMLLLDAEKIKSEGNGLAMIHATKASMEKRLFPLPNLVIQQQIVAEIEREQAAVDSAKELIGIFTRKITDRIAQIWNE